MTDQERCQGDETAFTCSSWSGQTHIIFVGTFPRLPVLLGSYLLPTTTHTRAVLFVCKCPADVFLLSGCHLLAAIQATSQAPTKPLAHHFQNRGSFQEGIFFPTNHQISRDTQENKT